MTHLNPLFSLRVVSRRNSGEDCFISASSVDEALLAAKRARTAEFHMVYIENNGERLFRWDRIRLSTKNRWRKVNVNAMETIGPIRGITSR